MLSLNESLARFFREVGPAVAALEVKSSRNNTYTALQWRRLHPFGASAFFIDERGYLLTAASLVRNAGRIVVTDARGQTHDAGVVGLSPSGEVALLRTVRRPGSPFPFLRLGDSQQVSVGDSAFTLGNPYGTLDRTGQVAFSRGTVSGIYQVDGAGSYRGEVLETDASVNPGSYGGPLLNAQGEVIGIQLEAFSFNRWLGTALPINQVKALLPRLRRREEPGPGRPGFECVERVVERHRARVTGVDKDSPAARAGLRRGDEIVEFGGAAIDSFSAFLSALHSLPAHTEVDLLVLRTDGPPDAEDRLVRLHFRTGPPHEPVEMEQRGTLGLRFTDPESSSVMEVAWVDKEGPAGRAGILPGDVLQRIEDRNANRKLLDALLETRQRGESVKLVFSRNGWTKELRLVLAPLRKM